MITKLFIIFLAIIAGTFTGYALSKNLKSREKYFSAIINLTDKLICEMKFRQSALKVLLEEFKENNTQLNANIDEFILYTQNGNELKLSKGVLLKSEVGIIQEFFLSLGSTDSDTQVYSLKSFKERLEILYNNAAEKNKKFGKTYIKLGFLFGLALGIILL